MKKVNLFLKEATLAEMKPHYEALGFKNQSEYMRAVIERDVHGTSLIEEGGSASEVSRLEPRSAAILSRTLREVLAIKHVVSDVLRAQCEEESELAERMDAIEADTRQEIRQLVAWLDEQEA